MPHLNGTATCATVGFLAALVWIPASCWSEEPGAGELPEALQLPSGSNQPINISLRQALLLAIRQNLDIKAARLEPKILEDDIVQASSAFDTVLTAESSGGRLKKQPATDLDGAAVLKSDTANLNLGAKKKLKTGTVIGSDFTNNRLVTNSRFVTVDSIFTSKLIFLLTQPLLRGRGSLVTQGPLILARNNYSISLFDFKKTTIDTVASTEKIYWDLVFSVDNLKVQEFALRQAQQLLEDTRERVRLGNRTPNDVVQAEAEVASREEDIILAEQQVRDAEDQLKAITNLLNMEKFWESPIVPLDRPTLNPIEVNQVETFDTAFANRTDYQSAKLDLENRNIDIVLAKNARYPKLDLTAALGLNGVRPNYGNTFDSLVSTEFLDWTIGLSLEVPFGFRAEKSRLERRLAEKAQALLNFKALERDIILELRSAIRQVVATQKRIKTTELALKLQRAKLEAEQELLKAGRSTTHDVLEFQLDLTRAQSNALLAVLEHQKARVELEQAKGTLLASRNFHVAGDAVKTSDSVGKSKPEDAAKE